ncbi:MAG: NADH-quinone oxidoreductase subunit M [Gammaproteobacteria bacterium]|nr:NADH-quinone oxidoreductase subunit M [Gammaproteobacteria bacterium]
MTATDHFSMLSLLIYSPLAGALLISLIRSESLAKYLALFANLVVLVIAIVLLSQFNSQTSDFQFVEKMSWISTLNIEYLIGVDGISILFLPLTALLFSGVIVAFWTSMRSLPRLYYSLLLLLETATLGIFTALDTVLFFTFWELTLIPIYFLVSLWGIGPNRRYAAVKYTLFMMAGAVPLLFGFVILALNHAANDPSGQLSFNYLNLLNTPLSLASQTTVFLLLLLGFGAKAPIFPFHTWLPTLASEGPVSIAAIMTGLKLGAYGFIRFLIPLTPDASLQYHWLLAGLGVIAILYGAVIAMNQSNIRRMLAYSSISHVGLVVLGIASFNIQGIQGALFQVLNFSIVAGGLFLITGFLHHRTGSCDSLSLGGVAQSMPLLAAFFFLFALASMGVPGTNGFIAEHLILLSSLQTHTGAGLAALAGMVMSAAYFLSIYRVAFLGNSRQSVVTEALDLRPRELALVLVFAAMILYTGLNPGSVLDITRVASEHWLSSLYR